MSPTIKARSVKRATGAATTSTPATAPPPVKRTGATPAPTRRTARASGGDFDERYYTGVLRGLPPSSRPHRRERLLTAAAAATAYALHGLLLTPDGPVDGYVVIEGRTIASVGTTKPDGLKPIDTEGVILPGLIDLHGHPEYNVFGPWEPPRLYPNRNAWRSSDTYKAVVRTPWESLTANPSLLRVLTRYAEARALVGGVTAIQGASAKYPQKEEALVRNVDLRIFGEHKARSAVDLDRADDADKAKLRANMDSGAVTAFYIHLAEGRPDNLAARHEFDALVASNLLTRATVIIHGTALTRDQLGAVADAGAKLVWSPQSNLRLYGDTTAVADAIELGVPIGLGADWMPSGSPSLLAELKVARRVLARQGAAVDPRFLVDSVTGTAADIAGLGDKLGRIAAGRPADLVVLERRLTDGYENVLAADPSWIDLVTIDGELVYGRADWFDRLTPTATTEDLIAWGKLMRIDTIYSAQAGEKPPRLADIRSRLIARFPQTGPILA